MITFNNSWDEVLAPLFENPEYLKIREFLKTEYKTQTIYPNMHDIFNCFKITDYNSVKAVILSSVSFTNLSPFTILLLVSSISFLFASNVVCFSDSSV